MFKVKFKNEIALDLKNQILNFTGIGLENVRVIMKDYAPWFVTMDICANLNIKNLHDAISRLDEDEKAEVVLTEIDPDGVVIRDRKVSVINEYGLYSLILSTRKKIAKAFKHRITNEIIPKIKEFGGYINPEHYMIKDLSKDVCDNCESAIDLIAKRAEDNQVASYDFIMDKFTSLANHLAGIENGKRDEADDDHLIILMRVQSSFAKFIREGIVEGKDVFDIYNDCKTYTIEDLKKFNMRIK